MMGNLTDAFFTIPVAVAVVDEILEERDEIDRALKQLPTAEEKARLAARRAEIEKALAQGKD